MSNPAVFESDQHTQRLLADLNPGQREAVLTTEGAVLVVAGPGSGKTRVLTHRIAYLIDVLSVNPDQILAVTFTNKAAREMRDRIEHLLSGGVARGLVMGTFHSFGVRILRQNPGLVADRLGVQPNFLIYDDADQQSVAKRAILAIGHDPKVLAPRRMLSRISAAKSMLISPAEFAKQTETYDDEVVLRVYRAYDEALRRANAVDFDDLLALPIQLFDSVPPILERYQDRFRYILVDEYQDTNRVQYVLVSALAAKWQNLFVVGDPDQSIYAWRQADIRNILDFTKDYPDARQILLEINYRSTRRIVETADRVIRENRQRIDRRLRTENDDGSMVVLRELSDQGHEANFVVGEIRRLLATGTVTAEGVAVMYRTTAQSRVLEEAFRTSEIPYRIVGGVRFYERKEVKDVLAILRLLYNPADIVSLERVLDNLSISRGFGPKALDALREWSSIHSRPILEGLICSAPAMDSGNDLAEPRLSSAARTAARRLGSVFSYLREIASEASLTELFDAIVERTSYQQSFNQDTEEDMQRWANVRELRVDLSKYDEVAPGEALPLYLEQVALVSDVDSMESDQRSQVTLITLHSAKGLEFPVVFITGVEEGLIPISRAIDVEHKDPAQVEEERRLFYVGITRAERQLYLTFTGNRLTYGRYLPGTASRFLANVPAESVHSLTRSSAYRSPGMGRAGDGLHPNNLLPLAAEHRRSSPVAATSVAPLETGQRVFHAKFGEGRVTEVLERSADQEVAVDFSRHGLKRLMASLAKLEVIGDHT
ncbi:MAG: UvrD-helicase domain-containing protein [Chloroflexota bacterium]|nr:UvrD-helicase domain-containing protein [Chloroflexota bacterium]